MFRAANGQFARAGDTPNGPGVSVTADVAAVAGAANAVEAVKAADAATKPVKAVKRAKSAKPAGRVKKPAGRWGKEKEAIFFRELTTICNVSSALRKAKLLGASFQVYERRRKDPAFRAAWDAAIDESYAMLEVEMLGRARFGDDRPAAETEAERRLREIPNGLALQLLRLHQSRKAREAAAPRPARTRPPLSGQALRQEIDRRLSELNRQMGGEG